MTYLHERMYERQDPQCGAKGWVPSLLRLFLWHLQERWVLFVIIVKRHCERLTFLHQMRS